MGFISLFVQRLFLFYVFKEEKQTRRRRAWGIGD